MKKLGISGGTKNSRNDSMCREALLGAKEAGAEVSFIHLLDLDIKHCTGCTACVMRMMSGKGNDCVLKDDFTWLENKMLDADGIVFSIPIFEKGAMGLFHTLMDRMGPRFDRGLLTTATVLAQSMDKQVPDPRLLKDKAVSYIAIGGSDWMTRIECDFGIQAMTPMWTTIDREVFSWASTIIVDEQRIKRAHEIGMNLANAAKDVSNARYLGDPGVCPHCHCREFYFANNGKVICCLCGIEGRMEIKGNGYAFAFDKDQISHAHDTLEGKFKHGNDIQQNVGQVMEVMRTPAYKEKLEHYKASIPAMKPTDD